MAPTIVLPASPETIARAVEILKDGGVVAFPTDTVYGLGCLVLDIKAIENLYDIKGREQTKAIAVLIASAEDLPLIAAKPKAEVLRLAGRFWPGPLTIVVPRNPKLPEALSHTATIGVRVPDHAVAQALLAAAGPMAVTSANLSGQANTVTAEQVLAQLDGRIELLIDGGQTPGETPSTVVEMTGAAPRVLRAGGISAAQIAAALE
jgi:L-threonylcarbamoyladenylate synthase